MSKNKVHKNPSLEGLNKLDIWRLGFLLCHLFAMLINKTVIFLVFRDIEKQNFTKTLYKIVPFRIKYKNSLHSNHTCYYQSSSSSTVCGSTFVPTITYASPARIGYLSYESLAKLERLRKRCSKIIAPHQAECCTNNQKYYKQLIYVQDSSLPVYNQPTSTESTLIRTTS